MNNLVREGSEERSLLPGRGSGRGAISKSKSSRTLVWTLFFFQAEDGIRDLTVTGVQTCALPISQVQQLRAQLHQQELSIIQKAKQQEELQKQIRVLQARIESSPGVQQEFQALTRDYQTALTFYNDLLKRRNESQMATALENGQQAERFRVIDPPSLPETPSFPNQI